MKITLNFLEKIGACKDSIRAWQDYGLDSLDVFECIEKLKSEQKNIMEKYYDDSLFWATWLLPHVMCLSDIKKYINFCSDSVKCIAATAGFAARARARAAEYTVEWAATAEWAAEWAAECAATAEWAAENMTEDEMSLQIIDYGIKLLKDSNEI